MRPRRSIERAMRDTRGAVAPTVALSLFGLIAAGGLAFDYSRMASLDTELQNAADQAALAAASQLDQTSTSCQRAVAAARTLITNRTLFANDGNADGLNVTIPDQTANSSCGGATDKIKFYSAYTSATSNTVTTNPLAARFVSVTVNSRQAVYALTPVVALFNSGAMSGSAVAGLGAAICKVPPVMICNPTETNVNTTFNANAYIGTGIKLVSVGAGSGAWVPGNFGYLNTGGGSNGAPGLREALGWVSPPGDCIEYTGVDTKPGATVSVTDAINTRFDIYDSNVACPTGGACPPSINAHKDVVRPGNANNNGNGCRLHNQGWQEVDSSGQYLPTSASTPLPTTTTPQSMGHPRDMCHAADSGAVGACTGPIGNGAWDRDAYFRVNYRRGDGTYWASGTGTGTWQQNTGLSATATRYQVYVWEINNRGLSIDGVTVLGSRIASGSGGNALTAYGGPQCSASQGYGGGTVPGPTSVDRRRISVAVVNCLANNVQGNSTNVPVEKWVEAFMVEPSLNRARTSQGDVYIEIIGETTTGGAGSTAGQVVRRDKPYLIE